MRQPTTVGPPACWGYGSSDADCDACRFRFSCGVARDLPRSRNTVSGAVADLSNDTTSEGDVDEVVGFIRAEWERIIGKTVWKGTWDGIAYKLNKIVPTIMSRCVKAGWDPAIYFKGQMSSMTPLLETGVPVAPGWFHGPKAEARFQRWVERRNSRYGAAKVDRTAQETARKERHLAATLLYAHARCLGGATVAVATEEAVAFYPRWAVESVDEGERLVAFSHVLGSMDPSLPHRTLIDPSGNVPTWKEMRELCTMLRASTTSYEHRLASLGEVL